MSASPDLTDHALPLIAILRGVHPHEVVPIAERLLEHGFTLLEVPLNSPEALRSIALLAERLGERALVGAGTVLRPEQAHAVRAAGGRLIVMPHADPAVIRAARAAGCVCLPGAATPTEAFAALAAGADGLKLFPAEALAPPVLKAWRAVLPPALSLFPVGGIRPDTMRAYVDAGASGFGLGSALYRPGDGADQVGTRAAAFVQAWHAIASQEPP